MGAQRPSVAPQRAAAPQRRHARRRGVAAGDAGDSPARRCRPSRRRPARPRPPRRACRAGWARSPASPPAWGSPRCCRISACPKALARFLLLALLAIGVVFVVRMLFARRGSRAQPLAYAGTGRAPARRPRSTSRRLRNGAARSGSSPMLGTGGVTPAFAQVVPARLRRRRLRRAREAAVHPRCRPRTTPAIAPRCAT